MKLPTGVSRRLLDQIAELLHERCPCSLHDLGIFPNLIKILECENEKNRAGDWGDHPATAGAVPLGLPDLCARLSAGVPEETRRDLHRFVVACVSNLATDSETVGMWLTTVMLLTKPDEGDQPCT